MIFLALGVLPVLRNSEITIPYGRLLHKMGLRYRWLGWGTFLILIITGVTNLLSLGFTWGDIFQGKIFHGNFGKALFWKLICVGVILILNLMHDIWLGPAVTRLLEHDPESHTLIIYRRGALWLGRIVLVLTIAVFYFGVTLLRGGIS